jgi:hypothetical protein
MDVSARGGVMEETPIRKQFIDYNASESRARKILCEVPERP